MGSVQTLGHPTFKQISEILYVIQYLKTFCELLVSIMVVNLKVELANRHFKTLLSIQIVFEYQETNIDWRNICYSV